MAEQPDPDAVPTEGATEDVPTRNHGDAWAVISYLLGGPIFWGGVGWLLDAWWGTGFMLPTGLVVGMGASLYLVWVRYGKA